MEALKVKIKIRSNIGTLLDKEGRRQTWLADQIGATAPQVNNWSKGDSIPSIGYILRIIKVTGWKLEDMFEEIEGE